MATINYLELLPRDDLKHLVKCFWISSNDSGSALHLTTLPDGCLELIVFYQARQLTAVSVFGVLSEAYDLVMPAAALKIGIRLKPLAKEYYLDKCPTLDRFANFTKPLHGNLSDTLQAFSAHVTADIMSMTQLIDHRKQLLFDLLQQSAGNIDVQSLSAQSFWSSRQINRYFTNHVGIPLKAYSNILKCYAAYYDIKAGDLNPDQGFYDQSHFIREIRKHTGTTPKMLLKNEAQRYLQFNDPGMIK